MAALLTELRAAMKCVNKRSAAWARIHCGVGYFAFRAVGGLGLARIEDVGDGMFVPRPEDGAPALILPAWGGGELIDLVAWLPGARKTLRRVGVAEMLGEEVMDLQPDEPVTLFAEPAAWAAACGDALERAFLDWERTLCPGGVLSEDTVPTACAVALFVEPPPAGVVLLDWAAAGRLCWASSIIPPDERTARRLEQKLRLSVVMPRILPASGEEVAA